MKINTFLKILFFTVITSNCIAKENIKYSLYENVNAEYKILYPEGILYPQGENENNTGQDFKSANMDAILYTFGESNQHGLTIDELYFHALNPDDKNERVFTYKVMKDNWFVVSGFHKDKIFYRKSYIADNQLIKTFIFRFDKSKSKLYNKITSKISKSFELLDTVVDLPNNIKSDKTKRQSFHDELIKECLKKSIEMRGWVPPEVETNCREVAYLYLSNPKLFFTLFGKK